MSSTPKLNYAPESRRASAVDESGLAHLEAMIESHGVARQPPVPSSSDSIVGDVVDTHHPHLSGRILVRWRDSESVVQEHWLAYNASMHPEIGRKVVLSRPSNWSEWIAIAVLSVGPGEAALDPDRRVRSELKEGKLVRLNENEFVRVESAQGKFLFELSHSGEQPVLSLGRDLTMALEGTLRVSADRIEMRSGSQGTDLRSEGSTAVRAPQVRIN